MMESLVRAMVRIRVFEEKVAELIEKKEIKTPCHLCIGQEAVAAGVCAALSREDYAFGGHRSHGHYLAKGGDMNALMAELFGKSTGCSRGRGGSMHLTAPAVGFLGTVPLVGATIPLAVGAALAIRTRGERRVCAAFFGDGAVEEGVFHESANFAALHRLPVLFVCENNLYASHLSLPERTSRVDLARLAEAHGIRAVTVDGNDAPAVFRETEIAVERAGAGPTFLECRTYRWRGHVGPALDLDVGARRRDELKEWQSRDPIPKRGAEAIWAEARREVEDAVAFARNSPTPDPSELLRHVYRESP